MGLNYIDMHCDTLTAVAGRGQGSLYENDFKLDLRRLGANGRSMEFFACFINAAQYDLSADRGWDYACRILDFYDQNIRQFRTHYNRSVPGCISGKTGLGKGTSACC